MPWIPVIRYEASKNLHHEVAPTYGAPSPTANIHHDYQPHPFNLHQIDNNKRPGVPHQVYGPPSQQQEVTSIGTPSSTYGPPSATYSIDISSQNPPSSSYGAPSSSVYNIPSSSYGIPSSSVYSIPSSSYGIPSSSYRAPSSSYGAPSSSYRSPSSSYGLPSSSIGISSSTFTPSSTYGTPSQTWAPTPSNPKFSPVTNSYDDVVPNYQPPQANEVEVFRLTGPDSEQHLPKVSQPTGFRNSYGEPINSNNLDIPYPVSAAEESSKIKTEVLLNGQKPNNQNDSFALAKPSPFSLNRGRNIHTLQPVALPNLSVSPLPPIFNARPFRTIPTNFFGDQGLNSNNAQKTSKVTVTHSVPVAEFTQSIFPPTFIQSPIIDVSSKTINQTKAYRNIPNSYVLDYNRDISSQASEDHINTKTNNDIKDISFESTGSEVGNELYDIRSDFQNRVPPNHRENFADLRGAPDDEVDKYRTDNNLQSIDSPLLYLKPSAPNKDFGHFLLAVSTPSVSNDYELYDESPTTPIPQLTSYANQPEESRNDHGEGLSPPPVPHGEKKPKVVQIIIPYTTGQSQSSRPNSIDYGPTAEWASASEDEYQARKIPTNTEHYYNINTATDNYNIETTTTEDPSAFANDNYEPNKLSTPAILNDLYDVREPPFDIIKLQQNIDDWTEQQFSQHYRTTQKTRSSGKYAYAKQIPDEYFTTVNPLNNYVTIQNHDFYDHEGSGSIQHTVTENIIETTTLKPRKEYNSIHRGKDSTRKNKTTSVYQKQNIGIYTAASSFRSTTTTPPPWSKIETSISPLTKEKVYVVTSKPWHENPNITDWYTVQGFESKKTSNLDNDVSALDNLPFKSPRFLNRPSFGGTSSDETLKSDSSYGFSKNWHQKSKYKLYEMS